MAVRMLLALGVLLLCLAEVSSDLKAEEDITNVGEVGSLVTRGGNRRLMLEIDCGGLCKKRCSQHSRPNRCNRACGTCCLRCKLRATGDFREQGGLRDLLYWHDHPWKRCQVPLTFTSPNMCCSHQGKK
ncbi:hypothetical protein ES288_D09G202900v1 [Gossypium darwinii]|uniref:Uncharacterized protein n=1 Tax=Gossypium darwinii TaxID=34276 RepID=A0A5D2BDL4_GOSDA|nr:hypothetical protein ES288_D09G202900v1 [Gossypium darwinii]